MKKTEILYLACLIVASPRMSDGWAVFLAGILLLLAVVFDVMERK